MKLPPGTLPSPVAERRVQVWPVPFPLAVMIGAGGSQADGLCELLGYTRPSHVWELLIRRGLALDEGGTRHFPGVRFETGDPLGMITLRISIPADLARRLDDEATRLGMEAGTLAVAIACAEAPELIAELLKNETARVPSQAASQPATSRDDKLNP